jgi:hypothetical protein
MYLGGYLGSAIMALLALRFGSYLFGGRSMVYGLELYGGLMIFSAYILYDTQVRPAPDESSFLVIFTAKSLRAYF